VVVNTFSNDGGNGPLPKPNVTFVSNEGVGRLTEDKIRGIICNPVYAGVGPFPAVIEDKQWVRAAAKAIEEDGAEQFLVNLLHVLRETFPGPDDLDG